MPACMELPDAIDLSHHLSKAARARATSPLKDLQKYFGRDGIISLAGGLPHPDLFPFDQVSARAYLQDNFPLDSPGKSSFFSWFSRLFTRKGGDGCTRLRLRRYAKRPGELNLATLLQYGLSSGLVELQTFTKEFVARVYSPPYGNWKTLVHCGNTDGWIKAVMTLCDSGDMILTSEWAYPSAFAASNPLGTQAVRVPMDGEGMRSDALLELLETWDENARGGPRPRVMYTVPVGQNPTGATMHLKRKKEIYEICVKFDIIIVEDDPYYFLQEGPYIPQQDRTTHASEPSTDAFLASLVPSYLNIDYQGRVVRLDSFSKTIAPGCRLGWFTSNPLFIERFERHGEVTTQAPSGFSQGLVTALLLSWKFDGYVRWLQGLRAQYRERRDLCVDLFDEFFDLRARSPGTSGTVYDGYIRSKHSKFPKDWTEKFVEEVRHFPVISFVPPTSGMFIWLQVNFKDHASFNRLGLRGLESRFWTELAEAGVLVAPGFIFDPRLPDEDDINGPGHIRLSFSNADPIILRKAVGIMSAVLEKFFYGNDQF